MTRTRLRQGLDSADGRALSKIHITPSGTGLSWPDLDVDFSLPALMAGIFGTREWMRKLAHRLSDAEQKA